jgi:ABC-type bacteriocin/lantibiotic exporter with double-glycine peptidase domain
MRTGEIISRIGDAVKIRAFINNTLISLIVNVLIVAFSFVLMFFYSWKMALIVMTIIPLYIVLYYITNKLNKKTERKVMEQAADLESHLVESLNTVSTIKRFGIESHFNIRTENSFIKLLETGYTSGLNSVFTSFSTTFFARLFTVIVLWTGAYFVLSNELTPGELMSFYAILGYFTGPLNGLINVNKTVQNAFIASDRLFEIMDLEHESENKIVLKSEMLGDIVFSKVSFRYGSRVDVFSEFDLKIEKSKITAIVGESGSGKSTLIHLLQNIYPITSGNIFINNIDITQVDNYSLRKIVGVVPQNINLFKGNIAENIAIGDFEPDMNKVMQISMKVGIQSFIDELPQGFFTDIGENGIALSGGQRQKIAFARVLYREPEIIILDEATSSLDSESEDQIMDVIQELKADNKTIIMIAHRLSTVLNADRIVVMEKGKVIESGSHSVLFNRKQKYYHLWQKQMPIKD